MALVCCKKETHGGDNVERVYSWERRKDGKGTSHCGTMCPGRLVGRSIENKTKHVKRWSHKNPKRRYKPTIYKSAREDDPNLTCRAGGEKVYTLGKPKKDIVEKGRIAALAAKLVEICWRIAMVCARTRGRALELEGVLALVLLFFHLLAIERQRIRIFTLRFFKNYTTALMYH